MKIYLLPLATLLVLSCVAPKSVSSLPTIQDSNTISFEVSPYGLIFTDVIIEGEPVKAMIDFGDPNVMQLSSTYVADNKLEVQKSNAVMMDIQGNSFSINVGTIDKVKIGLHEEKDVEFSSSPGEMESVSKQIGTDFHAVVGWGYFKNYYIELNYANRQFTLRDNPMKLEQVAYEISLVDNPSYLIFRIEVANEEIGVLLDTGSPVSVIDKNFNYESDSSVRLGGKEASINFYKEDLSVLADMDVKAILGGEFMSDYILHIHPKEQQIYFTKKST